MRCARAIESVPQDPDVFSSTTLAGVDDETAFFKCDSTETAGHHARFAAAQHEWTQIDVARFKAIFDQAGST